MLKSLEEIKNAAKTAGSHWFDRDTLSFFNSRINNKIYPTTAGAYFVTSEQQDETHPRLYSVRYCSDDGQIDTIGEFQAHETSRDATRLASMYAAHVNHQGADPLEPLKNAADKSA